MNIVLIAAVAENGVIGRGNALPWRLKSDMQHFRALTMGKPVIMGRKTYLSIGKPLAGRTTIVVSRDRTFAAPGIVVAPSLGDAFTTARGDALRRIARFDRRRRRRRNLCAGYAASDASCDHLRCTSASRAMRAFRQSILNIWRETSREEHEPQAEDEAAFAFVSYERTN